MTMSVIERYYADVKKYPLLTADQESAMLRQYAETRNLDVRKQFVQSNLRLVASMAGKYANASVPIEDLIQEGNLGLLEAFDRFQADREVRFSTYAIFWIRKRIAECVKSERTHTADEITEDNAGLVDKLEDDSIQEQETSRISTTVQELLPSLDHRELAILHMRLLNDEPTTQPELAKGLGCSQQRLSQIENRLKKKLRRKIAA